MNATSKYLRRSEVDRHLRPLSLSPVNGSRSLIDQQSLVLPTISVSHHLP